MEKEHTTLEECFEKFCEITLCNLDIPEDSKKLLKICFFGGAFIPLQTFKIGLDNSFITMIRIFRKHFTEVNEFLDIAEAELHNKQKDQAIN